MKYCTCTVFLAFSGIYSALAQAPADPGKVVLTVGNEKITAAEYDELIGALPPQYQAAAKGPQKRAMAEQIAQLKVLAAEAEKQKLDQQPKVQKQLAFSRVSILGNAEFASLQEGIKVDDAAVNKYYNDHKNDYEQVKARHVLIRVKGAPTQAPAGKPELTDEEALAKAQSIRKRVAGGEDFAAVAKAESDDTGSGAQGGDLGEFKRGMMVPPFEAAAFAAKTGEITEPVKSPFGYHVIKVESHTTKTLAEVRPEIEKALKPEMARQAVDALQKSAKVELDESFFGPPALPNPGAAPRMGQPAPAPVK